MNMNIYVYINNWNYKEYCAIKIGFLDVLGVYQMTRIDESWGQFAWFFSNLINYCELTDCDNFWHDSFWAVSQV
jgi:hypothetical protein